MLVSSPHLLAFSAFSKKGTKKNQRMAVGRGVTFTEVPSRFSVYRLISSSHFTDGKTEPQRGPGRLSMTGYWLAGVSKMLPQVWGQQPWGPELAMDGL